MPSLPSAVGFNKFRPDKPQKRRTAKILLAACGMVTGAVNGAFGAGGGMLAVPALSTFNGLSQKQSHATAIAVILPLCLVGSAVYGSFGGYDYGVFAPTIIGVTIGGIIGAAALKKISGTALNLCFYGLMLLAGLKMLISQ